MTVAPSTVQPQPRLTSAQVPQMNDPQSLAEAVQTFRELLDEGFKEQPLEPLPHAPARPQPDERLPNVEEVRGLTVPAACGVLPAGPTAQLHRQSSA